MPYIADGEFPDDEMTDISYMLESNDNYDDLLHDLSREDEGEGTKVRSGQKQFLLAEVVIGIKQAESVGRPYAEAVAEYIDAPH
jgi:hypothetical protein